MKIENIHFLPLSVTRLLDGNRVLNRDLKLTVEGTEFIVKEGFITDFSSWPADLIANFKKTDVAGVFHDHFYYYGVLSRRESDRLWRVIAQMGECSVNPLQAWLGWLGLRIGGWVRWRAHAKRRGSAY